MSQQQAIDKLPAPAGPLVPADVAAPLVPADAAAPLVPLQDMLEKILDKVFATDDRLACVERLLRELDGQALGDARATVQSALEALGDFFLGIRALEATRFGEAREHLAKAAQGFDAIGQTERRDVAIGLGTYARAVFELKAMNVGLAQQLLSEVRDYLKKAGRFAQPYEEMIDHMEPDQLFVQSFQAQMARDFGTAKVLTEQASDAALAVAQKYYAPETPPHNFFLGYSHYMKACYTVNKSFNDFNVFKFDSLCSDKDVKLDALRAREFLAKSDQNALTAQLIPMTDGFQELLDLILQLSPMLQDLFRSTFKPELSIYNSLRQGIGRASEYFSQAGPQAAPLFRLCDQLSGQVDNLERLAKPSSPEVGAPGPSLRETAAHESY
ncbi:MAG: hypothetical protein L0Z53_05945, partial [Acidobacteriales bacterium]|nr:hypothetical protein [Terriglobales bacterium]